MVTVRLLSEVESGDCERQGVRLNPGKKGKISFFDGSASKGRPVYIWHEPGLPPEVQYAVQCPSGELIVCNIYRERHRGGFVSEDRWTMNAGMIILEQEPNRRRYGCSDGVGPFDPTDFEFEVEWQEQS